MKSARSFLVTFYCNWLIVIECITSGSRILGLGNAKTNVKNWETLIQGTFAWCQAQDILRIMDSNGPKGILNFKLSTCNAVTCPTEPQGSIV